MRNLGKNKFEYMVIRSNVLGQPFHPEHSVFIVDNEILKWRVHLIMSFWYKYSTCPKTVFVFLDNVLVDSLRFSRMCIKFLRVTFSKPNLSDMRIRLTSRQDSQEFQVCKVYDVKKQKKKKKKKKKEEEGRSLKRDLVRTTKHWRSMRIWRISHDSFYRKIPSNFARSIFKAASTQLVLLDQE